MRRLCFVGSAVLACGTVLLELRTAPARASGRESSQETAPFAVEVVAFEPAPGQFVNNPSFNDPARALGAPVGGGTVNPDNSSIVSLGGFGGYLVLRFARTVEDHPLNPYEMDAIVFGNALWVGGDPDVHAAECATIEISRDANGNGLADDPWYLIPGSHIPDPTGQWATQTWDDNTEDDRYPPALRSWIPPGYRGTWTTGAYELPPELFRSRVLYNPLEGTGKEGIYGYAEYTPTLILGDLDADNVVDDPDLPAEIFYARPDDPFVVGITPGSGGGDAFDIAWAIDPQTGERAGLPGFDFIRLTNAVNAVHAQFGEMSPEIDAVSDVAHNPFGDFDDDGDIDLVDAARFQECFGRRFSGEDPCRRFDRDEDRMISLEDFGEWYPRRTGPR